MAWRLDEAVIWGELDNRTRGVVTGTIWLAGREQPLELELKGDARRDLAGRRVKFVNPSPRATPIVGAIATRQRGLVGEFTASRKIKVFLPWPGAWLAGETAATEPWSWSNGIYLEWFNTANERVLIEAVDYRVMLSAEVTWTMTAAEELRRRELSAAALVNHRARLRAAEAELSAGDYDASWDVGREAADDGRVEEPPAPAFGEKLGPAPTPQPEVATAPKTIADIGEALSGAAKLIQILDTDGTRVTVTLRQNAVKRLERVGRELEGVRLAVEFCRREKLAEAAWIEEVLREVRLHAVECERLLAELRKRESQQG